MGKIIININMQSEYDYLFKVLLIGSSGVGKSSLLVRFADDTFTDNFMPPIGVDFKIKTIEVDTKKIKLQIWDTAGQERFKTIIASYDITDKKSHQDVHNWMSEVEKHAADNISRILVGNKCDLEDKRDVSKEAGTEMAEHYGIRFLETSAKVSNNVEDAFIMMTKEIKNRVAVQQKPVKAAPQGSQAAGASGSGDGR